MRRALSLIIFTQLSSLFAIASERPDLNLEAEASANYAADLCEPVLSW